MKITIINIVIVLLFSASCSKKDTTITTSTTTPVKTDSSTVQTVNYADSSYSDLMPYSSGSTYSSKTPMGIHFEGLHQTTAADTIWLNDPAKEPSIPASTSGLHWATIAVNLFSYKDPDPVEVNQHAIGDCDGLAAMACMAYEAPDFIKQLIIDNGNGTYTVSMFDPSGKAIKVSVSSMFLAGANGEIEACSGQGSNTATWATVLEKAIMKYNDIYKFISDIGGIGSEYATPLFTGIGNSFAFSPGSLTPTHLQKVVKIALAKGQFVTGGFTKENVLIGADYTVTGHAYTVLISTDSASLFSMRNPWGFSPSPTGYIQDNGVLNIPNVGSKSSLIDVRIIDPGLAGSKGTTKAYQKPKI
ncbi:C2 family cysteine protease [Rhizosphaericola mali]|uniref:Calpain catalytic domain-containing protein n=1 Tax=Rhizosphaericola mali TaxID=2545455 RepID=A0A5P2G6K7_9BACT|nr:C2 family cysteine protease [Rhizosphaericola mali]QES87141.1 hypothetical protein E0W69_000120 [Rhizosphaericola mali]